ncbi:hypothetical protein MVEN_01963500 [Mycena venus]|uniref:Uncharacterized protein n=1 Tax=Mycena venus TaxID=2733690 RepID=A0A8H7CJX3_9AGAR|nr:hypothetical protein MVEN_01963500 [Mycena venus]
MPYKLCCTEFTTQFPSSFPNLTNISQSWVNDALTRIVLMTIQPIDAPEMLATALTPAEDPAASEDSPMSSPRMFKRSLRKTVPPLQSARPRITIDKWSFMHLESLPHTQYLVLRNTF